MAQQVADYETYKRIKLLGEGAFGKAYLAECVSDNALCVIKQVDLSKMSEQEKKDTLREAKILESFNHPNIVKFKEVYKTKKGKLCIVMDYADGGDLSAKIKAQKTQPFPENQVLDWFTQICLAIKHVHDRKIIHRDLKGQNIFLTSANIIKLGDFGIARVLSSTRENAKTMVGTPYYLSPEIINGKPYSFKSDIWSLGVVLYELCALRPPFDAQSLTFLAMKIVKGQYAPIPYQFSKEMKNLVGSLLQVEPSRRPTVNDVLKNSLIQNRIQNFLSKTVKIQEFSHTVLHKQQFVKNNVKFEDIKSVNNEAPIPSHLLKAQQQQQQQQQDKPKLPVQPAVNKPTPPLINPNALPDDKVKGPSADTPQFNRPQNNQGQDRPQLINYHNNQPKPNFHYRNSPNNPEPEPYKGPKIVDISKEKPVEPKKPDRIPPWQMRSPEEVQKPKVVEPPKNNAINRPQNPFYAEPKPQVQPAINRPEPVKRNEREILGGGLGGGGGLVMNFAPAKNQKEVVKKPAVAAPSSNKKAAAPQKSVADAKREAQLKMLEMKKKMENDKLKRLESEKMKKEKKALEDAERKQVIENQRQEREKDREEMRKKMREDMQNRKDAFRKGKTKDFDVEVVGYQTSSLNDLGKDTEEEEKQEEVIKNEQAAKVHRTREVRAKDERPRESSVPAREPEDEEEEDHVVVVKKANNNKRGPAKFVRNKMNRAFTKNANEGVEIFLPGGKHYDGVDPEESTDRETQEETKLESGVSSKKASPKSERNVEDSEPGQSEEIQKEDPFVEKLEENLENLGEKNEALNPKEIEQVQNISALIDVLNRTVRPELDANEAELTHLEVFSSKSEEQEDRDDDEVDDLCFSESNPADTKKFDPEEESMEYITDYSKLELLQMKLDNILGHDIFLQAYRVAKELFQKHSIDEIEEKYGKEDGYAALFPFMSEEARKHDLRFVFTYVICEEKAEQNGY